jgi:hypothetical protein
MEFGSGFRQAGLARTCHSSYLPGCCDIASLASPPRHRYGADVAAHQRPGLVTRFGILQRLINLLTALSCLQIALWRLYAGGFGLPGGSDRFTNLRTAATFRLVTDGCSS